MRFLLIFLIALIPSLSIAKDVEVVTRYGATSTVGRILISIVDHINTNQSEFNFRINTIPGAGGEIADQKALELSKTNNNVLLFSPSSSFTFNRFTIGNTYDRDNDFIKFFAISSAPIAIQVNTKSNINNFTDLIDVLKQKDISYFSSTVTGASVIMFNKILLEKYQLKKVKNLKYRTPYDISRSILTGESDYTIFNLSDISLKPILLSSDTRLSEYPDVPTGKEIGFDEFNFATLNLFSVPKEKKHLIDILLPMIEKACNDSKIQEMIKNLKYVAVCANSVFIEEKIKKELFFIEKYKNFIELRK